MGDEGDVGQANAERIRREGANLDYEAEAREAIARSWELTDPTCQALALQDATAYAILNLPRTQERIVEAVGRIFRFGYVNYRGEASTREVVFHYFWYGHSEYHAEDQFFLRGMDVQKKEMRDFAVKDIKQWL